MKILGKVITFSISTILMLTAAVYYVTARNKVDYISVMRYMSEAQYFLLLAIWWALLYIANHLDKPKN